MFGQTGNLSFFVTNAIHGSVYLTNVLGAVTNTGVFSNSIAVFVPTNTTPLFSRAVSRSFERLRDQQRHGGLFTGPVTVKRW